MTSNRGYVEGGGGDVASVVTSFPRRFIFTQPINLPININLELLNVVPVYSRLKLDVA